MNKIHCCFLYKWLSMKTTSLWCCYEKETAFMLVGLSVRANALWAYRKKAHLLHSLTVITMSCGSLVLGKPILIRSTVALLSITVFPMSLTVKLVSVAHVFFFFISKPHSFSLELDSYLSVCYSCLFSLYVGTPAMFPSSLWKPSTAAVKSSDSHRVNGPLEV